MKLNPENRWVKKADMIPWDDIEEKYAKLFPSKTGMPAKPLRAALGSLMIQKEYGYSDRELVEQIKENPYYQYFIGLPNIRTRLHSYHHCWLNSESAFQTKSSSKSTK
jgi:hypothetical protein